MTSFAAKHLATSQTVMFWLISFDICDGSRLFSPGMVNQKLCINTKETIQSLFLCHSNVLHGVKSMSFQAFRNSWSYSPEIRKWSMIPQGLLICLLIQKGCISLCMFCRNVQCNLCQIHIRSNTTGSCYLCML